MFPTVREFQSRAKIPRSVTAAGLWLTSALLLASCQLWSEPAPLVPDTRLIDAGSTSDPRPALVSGTHVTIGGVMRPALSAARTFYIKPACEEIEGDPDWADCAVHLPPRIPREAWIGISAKLPTATKALSPETAATQRRQFQRTVLPLQSFEDGQKPVVRLPRKATFLLPVQSIPPVETRTTVGPEIQPTGASALQTWIGLEEVTSTAESPATVFSVGLLRAGETNPTPLFHKTLDPAVEDAHRQWVPVEIPIPDAGEQPYRLVFQTRPRDEGDTRASLPVWGDPTVLRPEISPRKPQHVLLISLDTLRARSMSAYGYGFPTTPYFDALLGEGTLFENAFTTFSNTLGSHMSMLTGLYPANHRVSGTQPKLDAAIPTLASRMREAGYETAAFTENALLRADAGFRRGFARYHENKEIRIGAGDAKGTFARALEWISQQPAGRPLFVFAHTYQVHAPYEPPAHTAELFGDQSPLSPRIAYEREILYLDQILAEFLTQLEELAPSEDLLLVITADHGEEFHEHGESTHVQLFDEVMQVPLFMRWPGHIPAELRIAAPVSLIDVVPSILELVGAAPVPSDGASLVPLIQGYTWERKTVFGQTARRNLIPRKNRFIARSATAKCMVAEDGWSVCFDLVADPAEKNPLAPATSDEFRALHAQALAYKALALRTPELAKNAPVPPDQTEFDPQRQEKLRALGYVD